MKSQFELARSFLRQVIDKGRHLHDSDGEGLSEDEPGGSAEEVQSFAFLLTGCPLLRGRSFLNLSLYRILMGTLPIASFLIACTCVRALWAPQRGSYAAARRTSGPVGKKRMLPFPGRNSSNVPSLPPQQPLAAVFLPPVRGPVGVLSTRHAGDRYPRSQRIGSATRGAALTWDRNPPCNS